MPKEIERVKYMILLYGSQQDYDAMSGRPGDKPVWTPEDFGVMGNFMEGFNRRLAESGELVETRGLTAPVYARRIQVQNRVPVVTDGPYAETQEVLAGYWIIDCESFDRATEIAARLADTPAPEFVRSTAYADIRPILEGQDDLVE